MSVKTAIAILGVLSFKFTYHYRLKNVPTPGPDQPCHVLESRTNVAEGEAGKLD